jgi:hypothetical protein
MRQMGKPVWFPVWSKELESRNRMREFRTYGSAGEALGNQCLYPEVFIVRILIAVILSRQSTVFSVPQLEL